MAQEGKKAGGALERGVATVTVAYANKDKAKLDYVLEDANVHHAERGIEDRKPERAICSVFFDTSNPPALIF